MYLFIHSFIFFFLHLFKMMDDVLNKWNQTKENEMWGMWERPVQVDKLPNG